MVQPLLLLIVLALIIWGGFWLFRPRNGLFWRTQRNRAFQQRIHREDALKHVLRSENYGRPVTLESLAGALEISTSKAAEVLASLELKQLVQFDGKSFRLSAEGRDYALHVVRAHRLWERYLADETGYSEEDWHERADQAEHQLTPDRADALAAELGFPTHDPHGDPIPTSIGNLVPHGGQPLNSVPANTTVKLVHLEDEPDVIYAQLMAERLSPGMIAQVVEVTPERVRFWANGEEHLLAPLVAANISVIPIVDPVEPEIVGQPLSKLRPGEKATVLSISQASRGSERRRFMDLGILPGTLISAEMKSPSGDPTAYRIRDALIALRSEQAEKIRVELVEVTE
jgi:DtxR family Mn-dependent transcriptional regulator